MKDKLINKIFNENTDIFSEYMENAKISKEEVTLELINILKNLDKNIHVEGNDGKSFHIEKINGFFFVKLGYYEILDQKKIGTFVEQCTLRPTLKGKEIFYEYKGINYN